MNSAQRPDSSNGNPRFVVAQLGARMHYAVPRILHDSGMLERLYTDICSVKGWPRLLARLPRNVRPSPVPRLIGRSPEGVPASLITSLAAFGLAYAWKRARIRTPAQYTAVHLWAGRAFCESVIRGGLEDATGVYTFNSAGLELLLYARERGLGSLVEQTIAPAEIEDEILREEPERFPEWRMRPGSDPFRTDFIARERAEWDAADLVLCGSEFVRNGIVRCGGPARRCLVVPYGVDPRTAASIRSAHAPIRVLPVGAVCIRKGAPYLLEAARILGGRAQFRSVGPIAVSSAAAASLSAHADLAGVVPRSEIANHYEWADVFLLPTLCEGSATVCYEALAAGLPVITTPNAGSPVRNGVDGFIVPVRDPEAIVSALECLLSRPALLPELSRNAAERARDFTVARYAERLIAAITGAQLCADQPATEAAV